MPSKAVDFDKQLKNKLLEMFKQESLYWVRAGSDMYKRRAGWKYARSQQKLFRYMKQTGFIDTKQYVKSTGIRTCSSMAPNCLREQAFKRVLRKG